jgi:hypothetical protein
MTIEKLWQALEDIERREGLLDWKVGDVYLWPLVRMRLYREVAEAAGIFESLPDRPEVTAGNISHIANRFDFGVVPFLRRDALGNDRFSAPLAEALPADSTLVFGMGEHDAASGRPQIELLEREFLKRYRVMAKLLVLPTLRRKHALRWARVIAFLESEFNIRLSSNRGFPRWLLVNFVAQRYGFARLFRSLGLKKLFVVNAWKRAMIAGAQRAGVWVVEPQHGLLSDMHPLLSFTGRESVAYLPNELLVWGDYWAENAALPSGVRTTVIGAPAALTKARELTTERQPGTILFVSQAQHTTRLFEVALHVADANPQHRVTVKPHPQEDREQFDEHLAALGRSKPANLHFAERDAAAINLIAASEYVVGVYSMALVEAVALGAKVVAAQLPGWENLKSIEKRGDLVFADPNEDPALAAALKAAKPASDPEFYFAPPVSTEALTRILKAHPTA